jgi:hypothetical protein
MVTSGIWVGLDLNNKINVFGLNGTLVKDWIGWPKIEPNQHEDILKKFLKKNN